MDLNVRIKTWFKRLKDFQLEGWFQEKMTENIELGEDANCIYQILKKENNISSKRILDYAVTQEFEAICTGCVSGDAFLRAIKKLEKLGYVKSSLGKGGYRWQLLITE